MHVLVEACSIVLLHLHLLVSMHLLHLELLVLIIEVAVVRDVAGLIRWQVVTVFIVQWRLVAIKLLLLLLLLSIEVIACIPCVAVVGVGRVMAHLVL